jgi:protein-tyrosine phosphatase
MPGGRPYAVTLPDGTVVYGRGRREPRPQGPPPTFGLCLGRDRGSYRPSWRLEWVDWPDFRLPRDPEAAAAAIRRAHALARDGERVEITCGGGTGRTGTVIACLAVLAGVPGEDAVAWTRTHYRRHAVETPGQRRWVRRFADANR